MTINDIKSNLEELNLRLKNSTHLYLKLQQALLLLKQSKFDDFITIVYDPLKKVIQQELIIENYKSMLFNYYIEKSNIKNYFNKTKGIEEDLKKIDDEIGERDENKVNSSDIKKSTININEISESEFFC